MPINDIADEKSPLIINTTKKTSKITYNKSAGFWKSQQTKNIFTYARWFTYGLDSVEGILTFQNIFKGISHFMSSLPYNAISYSAPLIVPIIFSAACARHAKKYQEDIQEIPNNDISKTVRIIIDQQLLEKMSNNIDLKGHLIRNKEIALIFSKKKEKISRKCEIISQVLYLTLRMLSGLILLSLIHGYFHSQDEEEQAGKWLNFLEETEIFLDFTYALASDYIGKFLLRKFSDKLEKKLPSPPQFN